MLSTNASNDGRYVASLTGGPTLSAINTDLITGTGSGWFDASQFQSASVQIVATAGISAGAITFEQTNDITAAAAILPVIEDVATITPLTAAITIAASTVRMFSFPIKAQFFRVRISTAFVGGTVQAFAEVRQQAFSSVSIQSSIQGNPSVVAVPSPNTSSGFSTSYTLVAAGSNNAANIKNSAANVGLIFAHNNSAGVRYLKLFSKASAPTMGTDSPAQNIPIPAGGTIQLTNATGYRFSLGLGIALTTGQALLDNTPVTAGDVVVNIFYT